MRYYSTKTLIATALIVAVIQVSAVFARINEDDGNVKLRSRKLNGPRLGVTYVAQSDLLGRNGGLSKTLQQNDIGSIISLFGWHFEWLVTPEGGGPSFITQVVPLFGGVEYATIIPSATLILGIRMPKGFEFGLGPNLLFRFERYNPVSTALIVAIGKSIDFSGVSIPLNLAVATNNDGTRFSFLFGYAMGSKKK